MTDRVGLLSRGLNKARAAVEGKGVALQAEGLASLRRKNIVLRIVAEDLGLGFFGMN